MGQIIIDKSFAILQDVIFLISLINVLICILILSTNKKSRKMVSPFLILMIHTFIYYFFIILLQLNIVIFPGSSVIFMTNWSSALRFHSVGMVTLVGVNIIMERKLHVVAYYNMKYFFEELILSTRRKISGNRK